MAHLAYQKSTVTGTTLAMSAADAGGDTIAAGTSSALLVVNGDASSHTVTVVVPGAKYGQDLADVDVVVAAGETAVIGPFLRDLVDPSDGLVHVTYDDVTSVTVGAITI